VAREQSSRGRNREAARESEEWSAVGSADEGGRVEAEAGRGCRAAGVAGAWSPRGGRALTRSGRDARERRGATQRRPDAVLGRLDAALGWAERGAHERGGGARRQAGPASTVGQEGRRRPVKGENIFLNFYF